MDVEGRPSAVRRRHQASRKGWRAQKGLYLKQCNEMILRQIQNLKSRRLRGRIIETTRNGRRMACRESGWEEMGRESPIPSPTLRSQGNTTGYGREWPPHVIMPCLT